jgi:outer membrane protein TolC
MPIPPLDLGGINFDLPPIFVPEQDVKLMDEQTLLSSVSMMVPLFTGGLVPSFIRQARYGIQIAKQESRRTEHQIIYDVKRYYYAAVLTQNMYDIGKAALDKLQATLDLTENLYKKGSGRVTKTDYLKNKLVVQNVRSMVRGLKHAERMAKAALVFSMGLRWSVPVKLAIREIPYDPIPIELNTLVDGVYAFNPDWMRLELAIEVFENKVKEARSGYFPKIALIGGFTHLGNPYDFGMVTPQNKNMWTVGIGLDFNVFSGLRTKNRVKEAQYRLSELEEKRILLREGLALQVQRAFTDLISVYERHDILKEGLESAVENRDLTERAYQIELMEEKDLIESQIFESIMKVQYQKVLYDHIEAQAHLEYLIGSEFLKHVEGL